MPVRGLSVSTFLFMVIVCRDSRNFGIETWTFLVQEYDGSGRKQYCEQAGNSGEIEKSSVALRSLLKLHFLGPTISSVEDRSSTASRQLPV